MPHLNVKAVVGLLGMNEHTLRAWERRYAAITPARGLDGRRSYSEKDVARLKLLVELVNRGHAIGRIAQLSNQKLAILLDSGEGLKLAASATTETSARDERLEEILAALASFDLERLHRALQAARFDLSPRELVSRLVLPLLGRVGLDVAQGRLGVAQEHLLSGLLRDHLTQIYHSLNPYEFKARSGGNVALATREGDLHEFALLSAAIFCAIHGKRTHYFGLNIPAAELARACREFRIEQLVLGFSAIPREKEVVSAQRYLENLDELLPKRISIWLGGTAPIDLASLKSGRRIVRLSSIAELDERLGKT